MKLAVYPLQSSSEGAVRIGVVLHAAFVKDVAVPLDGLAAVRRPGAQQAAVRTVVGVAHHVADDGLLGGLVVLVQIQARGAEALGRRHALLLHHGHLRAFFRGLDGGGQAGGAGTHYHHVVVLRFREVGDLGRLHQERRQPTGVFARCSLPRPGRRRGEDAGALGAHPPNMLAPATPTAASDPSLKTSRRLIEPDKTFFPMFPPTRTCRPLPSLARQPVKQDVLHRRSVADFGHRACRNEKFIFLTPY